MRESIVGVRENAATADAADAVVFFVDGAGGGGLIIDWSREIRRGLRDGGFRGEFRNFVWQTGLGPVADACASVDYKRSKARQLLNGLRDVRRARPDRKVHVIAASAGTGVAVFALEAMGEREAVDSLILLSSALSSSYDLTRALAHVRGEMHVFTSQHDALLKLMMPVLGTTDREYVDARVGGLEGFDPPHGALGLADYEKIREVPWRSEWATLGHFGGHTDCKSPAFVREVIAPLLTER
jgi:hypothetical protein